jgi:hypothetical protein
MPLNQPRAPETIDRQILTRTLEKENLRGMIGVVGVTIEELKIDTYAELRAAMQQRNPFGNFQIMAKTLDYGRFSTLMGDAGQVGTPNSFGFCSSAGATDATIAALRKAEDEQQRLTQNLS